jgi:hypothetical protein
MQQRELAGQREKTPLMLWHSGCNFGCMSRFGAAMHVPENLRIRISALGELSRPLGESRAAALARRLAQAVARDVALGRDTNVTIDGWIREIAIEIADTSRRSTPERVAERRSTPRHRSLADVLPEVR